MAIPQAIYNGLLQASNLAMRRCSCCQLPPALQAMYQGIAQAGAGINQSLGRPAQAPARIEESINRVMEQPRQWAFGQQPATPNAAATGNFAGAMFGPGVLGKLANNPVAKGIIEGTLGAPPLVRVKLANMILKGAVRRSAIRCTV